MSRVAWAVAVFALWAAPAHARAPLVPRDLAPLAAHTHTLLEVDPTAASTLAAAGGEPLDPELGIWRLTSAQAVRLVPRLAVAGVLREVEPERPLVPLGHLEAGDPLFAHQWWYAHVGADVAEPPGPGVPLVVVDSGLDVSHPEFAARPHTELVTAQTVAGERELHGTAVASVAAAPANGVGLVGAYPEALLRSYDASPRGRVATGDLVAGLRDAAARGRAVANVSLGGSFRDAIVEHAVLAAFERGVVVVAAAGNSGVEGNEPSFPAALPHVLTVGATDAADAIAPFSTRSQAVDVVAPGDEIPVAVPVAVDPTGYQSAAGTSFAAPIVAAAAAWLWTARPELDATQVLELVRRTARDVGPPGRDPGSGFGLLDVPALLTAPAPAADPLEPNDDVDQVAPGGLFARAKPPLTRPGKGRAALAARLDRVEDPTDVYRVWVPARRRVTVEVRSARDVDVELWRPGATTVLAEGTPRRANLIARSARRGGGAERVFVDNAGRSGGFVYASVAVSGRAALHDAGYRLTVTTAARPPRR